MLFYNALIYITYISFIIKITMFMEADTQIVFLRSETILITGVCAQMGM